MAATELGGPCPDSLKSRMRLKSITACSNPGQSDPPHRAMLSRSLCPPAPSRCRDAPQLPHTAFLTQPQGHRLEGQEPSNTSLHPLAPTEEKSPSNAPVPTPTVQTAEGWVFPRQVSGRALGSPAPPIRARHAADKPQQLSERGQAARRASQLFDQGGGILASAVSASRCWAVFSLRL